MTTTLEASKTATVRQIAERLEQLLSDPHASSGEVVGELLKAGLPTSGEPPERIHRRLIRALAEAVQRDGHDWLLEAVETFLEPASIESSLP